MKKIVLILLTIGYLLTMRVYWQTVSADESYVDSQKQLKEGNFDRAIRYANKSIKKNPNEPRYYYGRAKVYLAKGLKEEALSDLRKAEGLNNKNLVTLRNIVPLYYFLTINDLSKEEIIGNVDEKYIEIAKTYFASIKNLSPTDVGIYTLLATYEKKLNLTTQLSESLENIERLRPGLLDWYLN